MSSTTRALIFLTWRGKRLFDVSTCKSMGLKVDGAGKLRLDGEGFDHEGRVHVEAWTEETYAEYEQARAAERKRQQQDPLEEEDEDPASAQPAPEAGPKFKIMLKAKNLEPFKLIVKPTTTIAAMINAFRKSRGVEEGREVSLHFEGDKLEPESAAGDADLDPDDITTIDVHVH